MSATVWPRWLKPTRPVTPASGERAAHRRLDARAREEVGIRRGPEARRVLEGEGAEVVLRDQAVLDELPRLLDDLADVAHVPVADVRAEDRVEPRPERVAARVEGPGVQRVVGLAAEVEARHEAIAHVLGALDPAGRELVERVVVVELVAPHAGAVDEVLDARDLRRLPVIAEEPHQLLSIEARAVERVHRTAVALLPVGEQIRVEAAAPGDPALEEREAQAGEALRDAAEEERLAGRLAGGG